MSRIRVLLIEDDYYSRRALYSLLSKDRRTTVIDETRDVDEALWLFQEGNGQVLPDVILFDVDLFNPRRDPITEIQRLIEASESQGYGYRLICCTMEPTLALIRDAVEAGVDGILQKEEVASGIADVVERAYQGAFVYTRSVSQRAFGRLQGVRHSECYLVPERREVPLDRKLHRVARLYCEDGLSAAEVGEILHLSVSGVRRRLQQLYKVLGARNRQEARQRLREMEWQ